MSKKFNATESLWYCTVFCVIATSAASERVFSMTGYVVNSRRTNLKSSSVNDVLFSAVLLKLRKKRLRLTKRFHIFNSVFQEMVLA